jgi:intergrase/recombinase
MTAPKRLTPEQIVEIKERANLKRRVRRLWAGDLTLDEICEEIGMLRDEFLALAATLGLTDRQEPDVYIPTVEQIRIEAAIIRSQWSQAELEARRMPRLDGRLD